MNVKVYSTPTCPWCTKVKEFLKQLNVAYEEVDVSSNREAAMEMVKKTRQMGVPVTQINERFIVGFNASEIESALKDAGILKG
ncbi:MAG: NrdH-redoxin [Synergistaceae bacterium]|jgi:glutaredoxin-like YruB-family protein|nr:NrdH-redoxin [Synergistaceae bacterium]